MASGAKEVSAAPMGWSSDRKNWKEVLRRFRKWRSRSVASEHSSTAATPCSRSSATHAEAEWGAPSPTAAMQALPPPPPPPPSPPSLPPLPPNAAASRAASFSSRPRPSLLPPLPPPPSPPLPPPPPSPPPPACSVAATYHRPSASRMAARSAGCARERRARPARASCRCLSPIGPLEARWSGWPLACSSSHSPGQG
eukprot:scaffold40084_cov69-Phaeocystis_antarctica.AAC.1